MACPPAAAEVADAPTFARSPDAHPRAQAARPKWCTAGGTAVHAKSVPDAPAARSRTGRRHPADRGLVSTAGAWWTLLRPSARRLPRAVAGRAQGEPGLYDDMSWIGATYALPGGIVIGLASNEWSAYRTGGGRRGSHQLRRRTHDACLLYSITQIVSQDEGARSLCRGRSSGRGAALPVHPQPTQASSAAWRRCRTSLPRRIPLRVPRVRGVGEQRSAAA